MRLVAIKKSSVGIYSAKVIQIKKSAVPMVVDLIDKGTHNELDVHPWYRKYGHLRVEFSGSNCSLRMSGVPRNCTSMHIRLGSCSTVNIGAGCGLSNTFIFVAEHCCIDIGSLTKFAARAQSIMHEPSKVKIGEDCMIASDVEFMTSEGHTIYNCGSSERLNRAQDIEIGDHVWISLPMLHIERRPSLTQ